MAITTGWHDPERSIFLYRFEGRWTWQDLYDVYYPGLEQVRSVSHRVDTVVDLRQSGPLPGNMLLNLKFLTDNQPPNAVLITIISTSQFVSALYEVAVKFYSKIGEYFCVVPTLEAALETIWEDRKAYTS
jgi:hypothetical protein